MLIEWLTIGAAFAIFKGHWLMTGVRFQTLLIVVCLSAGVKNYLFAYRQEGG